MKKINKISLITLLFAFPSLSFAATRDLNGLISLINGYFKSAVYLIMALAVVMFVWNVYRYFISGSDDATQKKEAGLYVMWSVIGFFVIISMWGLVNIVKNTLNLDNTAPAGFFGLFSSDSSGGVNTNTTPAVNKSDPFTALPGSSIMRDSGRGSSIQQSSFDNNSTINAPSVREPNSSTQAPSNNNNSTINAPSVTTPNNNSSVQNQNNNGSTITAPSMSNP